MNFCIWRRKECLSLICLSRGKMPRIIKRDVGASGCKWAVSDLLKLTSGHTSNQMSAEIDTGAYCLRRTMIDGERCKERGLKNKVRWDGENVGERCVRGLSWGGGGWRQMAAEHEKEWRVRKRWEKTWSSGTKQGCRKKKEGIRWEKCTRVTTGDKTVV